MSRTHVSSRDTLLVTLAIIAATLAAATAAGAWLLPDFYANDPAAVQPQLYGQDLVTLLTAGVIAVALWRLRRGSIAARVVVLGGMLYLAYGYLMYAVGVRFNAFFLAYVVILSASTFALVVGTASFPVRAMPAAQPARRSTAAFLLAIPFLFGALWLVDILGAYAGGRIPAAAAEVQMPTSPVHVEDLAFVLPLSAAAGVLVWRRHEWGPVLAGIVLVKAITICLAMLAMGLMAWVAEQPVNTAVAAAALVTLAFAATLSTIYFRAIASGAGRASTGAASLSARA